MDLHDLGWDRFFQSEFDNLPDNGYIPARVTREEKKLYHLITETGECLAEVSGRFMHQADMKADYPTVGDWVAISSGDGDGRGIIHARLPRKSKFARKAITSGGMPETGGRTDQQVMAANVDTVFLVSGLDLDFNLRRIERFISAAYDSGAMPVIILNKADICDEIETRIEEVEAVAFGIPIIAASATRGDGLDEVREYIAPGKTVVFLGSSGVGKSTIINGLLGEDVLKTKEVRDWDSRGRHTTTWKELIVLPQGGIVIDTPGIRRVQLWGDEDTLDRSFDDVAAIAAVCRFADCSHNGEPGCAIELALADGRLDKGRYRSYLKQRRELDFLARRKNHRLAAQERAKWKRITVQFRKRSKHDPKYKG